MNLTDRFIEGIRRYNLTLEEIQHWKYCGGDQKEHLRYFELFVKTNPLKKPPWKAECTCGHAIKENCYITNGKDIMTLGICCIKKFVPNSGRTCEMCGNGHRNRKVNRCNECRVGKCDGCHKTIAPKYKLCWSCFS